MHGVSKIFFPPLCTAPKPITCVGLLLVWMAGESDSLRTALYSGQSISCPLAWPPREDGIFDSVCQEECAEFQKGKKKAKTCLCLYGRRWGRPPCTSRHLACGEESVCCIVWLTTYSRHQVDCNKGLRLVLNCTRLVCFVWNRNLFTL